MSLGRLHTVDASQHVEAARNGLARTPLLGWSSWSLTATNANGYGKSWLTATHIKAQSDALRQKLQGYRYDYINIDSFWAQDPSQAVDAFGRWTYDTSRFPNGIADVAAYVHRNGQKLGVYLNPGIAKAAVNQNTPIQGTSCHAKDIAAQPLTDGNVFGDTYQINFSKPCAQAYINSEANLLASWGVNFLKIDAISPGSGSSSASSSGNKNATIDNRPDVKAWALALWGKKIWLELSWSLDIHDISTWWWYANGWRIDTDVECYCNTLVTWDHSVKARFNDVAAWAPYAGPGGWNDLDSLDVGNGSMDGISLNERQSYMTLWAIQAAPLYSGDDLTTLDKDGLSMLTNKEVLAVDQAGHPAKLVSQSGNLQVWSARNNDGTYTMALFNLCSSTATVTLRWRDLGITNAPAVRDLWSHAAVVTPNDHLSVPLNTHASRLLKLIPTQNKLR